MVEGVREIVVTGGAGGSDEPLPDPPPQPAPSPMDSSASAPPATRAKHPCRLVRIEASSFFSALRRSRCCAGRSEEHTSELQSQSNLVCRLLLEKKKKKKNPYIHIQKKKKNHQHKK